MTHNGSERDIYAFMIYHCLFYLHNYFLVMPQLILQQNNHEELYDNENESLPRKHKSVAGKYVLSSKEINCIWNQIV